MNGLSCRIVLIVVRFFCFWDRLDGRRKKCDFCLRGIDEGRKRVGKWFN